MINRTTLYLFYLSLPLHVINCFFSFLLNIYFSHFFCFFSLSILFCF